MKTIQEYLQNADIDRLVQEYFQIHPIEYENITDGQDLSIGQIRQLRKNRLTAYIHRLQTLEIMPCEDGKEYILFAHQWMNMDESVENIAYSLVCKKELLEKGTKAQTYAYEYARHSEVMGYFVSDAEFTQKNIYGLMADVLYETTFFGYEEEDVKNARQELEESIAEAEQGNMAEVSMEELFGDEEEPDAFEEKLHSEFIDAQINYGQYCMKKEMDILRQLLSGATKEDIQDFGFYEDIKFARLEERHKGSFVPVFDDQAGVWVVDTEHGVEYGDAAYVAAEFCGDNAVYLFNNVNMPDPQMPEHGHSFEEVVVSLIENPKEFSVESFKECYSLQELRILRNLQEALLTVKGRNAPLSREEMKRNRERWEKKFS